MGNFQFLFFWQSFAHATFSVCSFRWAGWPSFRVELLDNLMWKRMAFKYRIGFCNLISSSNPNLSNPGTLQALLWARWRLGAISRGGWELQLPSDFLLPPHKERMGICWRLLSAICICPHSHSVALANEWEKSGQRVICSQLTSCCCAPGMEEADKWPCVLSLCQALKFKRLRETEESFLLPFARDIAYLMLEYSKSLKRWVIRDKTQMNLTTSSSLDTCWLNFGLLLRTVWCAIWRVFQLNEVSP